MAAPNYWQNGTTTFGGSNFSTSSPNLGAYGANPYASPLQGMISNFKAPSSVTPTDLTKMDLPLFDMMRQNLSTQFNQQQQQGQDAINRQFAAMGGGPSGAQVKQTENLAAGVAQAKEQGLRDINAQEAQTRTQLTEQQAQENLQAQEFNTQMGLQGQELQFQEGSSLAGLNTAWDQAQEQSTNDAFNKAMGQYQAQHSGGLFGGGGFLGLGL